MTPIYGLTEGGVKQTGRDRRVLPKTVLYDPELMLPLPLSIVVPSAMNALAHAVEALYAESANPLISLAAEESVRALAESLPQMVRRPEALEPRAEALYAAWLAGQCLGAVGMALHHRLCHLLGGRYDLPHAETHAALLPHVVAYNQPAAPQAMRALTRALGTTGAASGVHALARSIGAPLALAPLGMPEDGIEQVARLAAASPPYNPRPVEEEGVRGLLEDAYWGRAPSA